MYLAKWRLTNWLFWPNDISPFDFWPNDVWPIDFWAKWCLSNWLFGQTMFNQIDILAKWCLSNWLFGQMVFDQLTYSQMMLTNWLFGQMMFDKLTLWPNDVWPIDFFAKWCLSNWLLGQMMFDQLTFGPNDVWPIDCPIDFWAKWCLTNDQLNSWLNDVITLFFHCRININDLTAVWNHRLSSWRRFLPLRRPQLRQSEDVRRQRDVLLRRRRGKKWRRDVLELAGLNLIKLFAAVNYELSL